MSKADGFEMDFVYTDIKTDEFKNVHIKLNVNDDIFLLEIYSEDELAKNEIEEILNQLNSTFFKRMHTSLVDDCKIVVKTGSSSKTVEIASNGIIVKKITPMEG